MKKNYVLDTNVLVHDPASIYKFAENNVIIPLIVVEELDNLKTRQTAVGQSARRALKELDRLRSEGVLHDGIDLENGGSIRIEVKTPDVAKTAKGLDPAKPDNKILAVALSLAKTEKNLIVVSKDVNLRIKADALGVIAEDYESSKVNITEIFKGFEIVNVDRSVIETFYQDGKLRLPEYQFYPNQCVLLKVQETGQSALCKYYSTQDELLPLYHIASKPWNISARNLEQRFSMELLLSDQIKLVSIMGRAGTGKTLLALACGLQKVVEEKAYKKLLVARPVIPMGKDIGFLPGSKYDKLSNWMQPITDNLDFLFASAGKNQYEYLSDRDVLEVEALTYIRGRSLPNCYFIIDEAQNLSPHEVKTIITRAGEGSKIVLTGDPYQIDNSYLDEFSNGLSYVSERFKDEEIAGHIMLSKGERSLLATRGSELL